MVGIASSSAISSESNGRSHGLNRLIRRHLSATALIGGLAATILLAVPAVAQDTHGGRGGQGNSGGSPAGGTSSSTGAGGAGGVTSESYEGAGGGGAGVTGGAGGNASDGSAGGTGGATAGASGGDGVGGGIGSRASGGGGGAHGAVLSGAPGTAVTGGKGGNGGGSSDGDGGGGGAGGYGAVSTGTGTIFFNNAITAGNGGNGGYGYFYGGSGGDGGIGLLLTGTGATVSISGAVTGGNGGAAGNFVASGCCANGSNGAGGIGLIGSNVAIVLHATVGGGLGGDGVSRALAMRLGGTNQIALASGWGLVGGIEIAGTSLEFVQGNDQVLSNDILGVGRLIKSSIGNLTLSGNNSYAGGTEIRGGTLTMGSANALSTGDITLNGGTLDIGNQTLNLSRAIRGTGTVSASGSGVLAISPGASVTFGSAGGAITSNLPLSVGSTSTLTLLGNNNLTGGIALSGRMTIGESGAAGGSGNTITSSGAVINYISNVTSAAAILLSADPTRLAVLGTGVATQSGVISSSAGTHGIEKIGTGALILSATNSYTGATIVTAGTLGLAVDGAAGTGTIQLANGTTLLNASCGCTTLTLANAIQIASGSTATFDTGGYQTLLAGNITGGNLVFADTLGGSTTYLTGTNSYGTTRVTGGATLMVGNGGTTGTLGSGTITVDALGMLAFNRSDTVTLATAVTGDGFLGQFGSGTLILAANNSYTGRTILQNPAGTLQVGAGGTTGSLGSGSVVMAGGTLVFNRSDDLTFAGSIAGNGTVTKLGAGTLTLSGDSLNGVSGPYTGTFSVQAGTLAVNQFGLGASQLVEIDNGAALKALENSYAGDVAILSGGGTIDTDGYTFDVIGALDLQGELTKTGSGTLLLEDLNGEGKGAGGINVTAGTLGLGSDFAAGTGLIKLANGTTLLNASCGCSGTLAIDNAIQVAPGGTATFDGGGKNTNLNGAISGGAVHFTTSISAPFAGSIFRLNGANSYGETLIGPNVALIVHDGTLGTGNVTFDAAASDPTTPASLVFQNATDYSYAGQIIGAGLVSVESDPASSVTLSSSNSATANFTGAVDVISGRLVVNGSFGDVLADTARMTLDGGTLGGSGTFHGSVTIGNAALNPGNSPGTLAIAGNLSLGSGTILNYELGAPGTVGGASNDLVTVGGNLTLDGTLNTVGSGAGYGPGYYRLLNYGGSLTDNGLDIGSIADGLSAQVLTNVGGQVNLRLGGAQAVQYWDGADMGSTVGVTGGAGTWNGSGTNWTSPTGYAINDSWESQVGVFAGNAGGTVTVVGTQSFQELRFETDGYVLRPINSSARLNTSGGFSIVDIASGITADIGVVIQGGAGIDKTGNGTLILSARNAYSGATDIAAGTLRLGIDNALADPTALTISSGATLDLNGFSTHIGSLAGTGIVTLGSGRLDTGYNNSSTIFGGTITGADGGTSAFTKNGSGTLTVSGSIALGNGGGVPSSFAQVNAGTLQVGGTGSLSADLIQNFSTIENSGTITAYSTLHNFSTLTNNVSGVIEGGIQNFSVLGNYGAIGSLTSLGGTATNYGTGVINGNVQTFANFISTGIINGSISNFSTALIENQVNGEVGNFQSGATVTLTGTVTGITNYQGATGSLLDLAGFDTTIGGLNGGGDIQLGGATLTVDNALDASFNGGISGSGGLTKTGAGTLTLGGASTYGGTTVITGGALILAEGATLGGGAISNSATLAFDSIADRSFGNMITGNTGIVVKSGSGLLSLTGTNSYGGGTQVQAGTLGFDNNSALGSGQVQLADGTALRNHGGTVALANAITVIGDAATLEGVGGSSTVLNGAISGGDVRFAVSGPGTASFTLGGANSYGATAIGSGATLNIAEGTPGSGAVTLESTGSTLNFANGGNYTYAGVISGNGQIGVNVSTGATLTLSASNSATQNFTGSVTVSSGRLALNGDFGDVVANNANLTLDGGVLGGSGTFHGNVSFGNASLNPGNSPGTLDIAGNLTLGAATTLNYELSQPGVVGGGVNDLVNVGGDLTLDGTLNVTALAGFGEGYYRLFNYGGSLTNNGLNLGALPAGYTPTLRTNIAGQVNILFSSSPQAIQYWDGSDLAGGSTATGGDGGAGIWSGTSTNWTAPTGYGVNDSWRSQVAVFGGASGGAVTVQGIQAFQELRFTTGGYTITAAAAADGLSTTGGFSVVDVSTGLGATINATISGTGGLTKTGTGTLSLGGGNSYTGTTTVSAGALNLLAGASIAGSVVNQASFANAGTVTGAVQNDGTFTNSGTVAGVVQNNATLTSTGALAGGLNNNGTALLAGTVGTGLANNGAVTFSGAATVTTLQQGTGGSFNLAGFGVSLGALSGSGAVTLGNGALSVGASNGNSSFGGTIAGAGSLTKNGTGTLMLTGAATHTGGTTIAGGTLQIGNGGTTGSLSGALANNGILAISRSDAVTLANAISGNGGFVQAGTGTTTLTGANSYSGGTLVSTGRLRGDTASLQGDIRIDGALEFAQAGAGTYAGSLSGTGLFDKTGTGTLNVTGSSATFAGATNLLSGGLALNGLLSRSVITVGNSATLSGTGTAGGVVLQSGATIAPGNSVGTFNVAGNFQFMTGSLYLSEVQAGGADRIQATGTAQLAGTLQVINLGGNYGINSSFVLLHADGGLSGTFATTDLASFGLAYRPKIIYTANEVQLLLAANQLSAVLGTGVPLTYNQTSTIARLDAAVVTGGYDPTPLSALYSLAPTAIPAALDQLSGEIYADATRAALEDERVVREAAIGRLAEAADLGLVGNGSWGQAIGSWGSVDADGNVAGYDVNRTGFLMGIDAGDATEEGSWRAGVLGQYTRITVPASARGSRATIDRTGGGFYAGAALGGLRIRTGATLSVLDLKARRTIAVPGFDTSERGKTSGVMLQTFAELSYRIEAGAHGFVEPYLAGSVSRVSFGRFAEKPDPVALMVHRQKNVLGIAELGVRGEVPLVGGDKGGILLGGNIGLRTAFGDRIANPLIALTAAPDQAFNMHSAEIDRFAAAANLNLSADLSDTLSLRIGYTGVLGGNAREHGARATFKLSF
ncbi:autotransporter-associated beta strand repeat-containing protein [Sphingomonas sp. MMS12-HWE2-04]|uniref:autotransporter-associated beta strand repeat-containing protein n=1 Tax=Sphingomonas sp. MMS12-HWE2-04 TaxID=3234199 RepID=UPI00384F0B72